MRPIGDFAPRVATFRASLIKMMPRSPRNKTTMALLNDMPTRELIGYFINWRMRLIPPKPRAVTFWPTGVTTQQFLDARQQLLPLFEKVASGADLTPHLSTSVEKLGIVLPGASPANKGKDLDSVLIRSGLHHFHVGAIGPNNPRGRSDRLVFAEVLSEEFRVVAISSHGAFAPGSEEHQRFYMICRSYVEKDMSPDHFYMANPVMSSGHSMLTTMYGLHCEREIERLDPLLDDRDFSEQLFSDQTIYHDGNQIVKPHTPSFAWHFDDLKFGLLERRTKVFFCRFPFFTR